MSKIDLIHLENIWSTGRVSIYEHIQKNVLPDESGLSADGLTLADEDTFSKQPVLSHITGALDGIYRFEKFDGRSADEIGLQIADSLCELLSNPSPAYVECFYHLVVSNNTLSYSDPLMLQLIHRKVLNDVFLKDFSIWLTKYSPTEKP